MRLQTLAESRKEQLSRLESVAAERESAMSAFDRLDLATWDAVVACWGALSRLKGKS
jgi:hypothetical protein